MRDRAGIAYLSESQTESVIVERRLSPNTVHLGENSVHLRLDVDEKLNIFNACSMFQNRSYGFR
jgi:hypothetical protein